MTEIFTVRFDSVEIDSPRFVGPFYSLESAVQYCDHENYFLSLRGIPGDVAFYSIDRVEGNCALVGFC